MTAPSTSSTNDANTASLQVCTASPNVNTASPQVSTASFSDNDVYAFMVENPNGSNLLHQDLEKIHEDDLEAMDLKWQLSLLSIRAKSYYQRTGKKIFINANDTAGYDNPRKQGNNEDTSSKTMLAIDGVGFDWSDMAEEQVQTNMALMTFSDSELNQTEFIAATYKIGLATVEEQLITYRKNEVLFSEEVAVLKREVACKDYEINVLKSEFEKVKQEKEGIEFKIEKFDKASKDLDKLLESQITDKSKKGLGYSVVHPPHPLIYNRPKKLDLSSSGLDEFKVLEFKGYGSQDSKTESSVVCDKKSDDSKENSDNSLEKEANIALIESWDNTQAMMEADFELAQRLQAEEQGEITIEERSRLFVELMNKRKKHFPMLRTEEKRRKPPTKAQKRNLMSTYLKNMGGYKHNQLKSKSYEEIQKLFNNEMRRVNTFIPMYSESKKVESSEEKAKGSRMKILGKKRAEKEQQQESSKRQRMEDDKETDEHEEVEVDDEAKLKKHLVIVKDDDIAIDAIPLATKPPVIVEYKIIKEGIIGHYQLIRADGSSKRYSSMIRMLQDIDREDLETLWKLVKTKHGDTRPEDEHERVLWGDLKVMFEPDIKSDVWRNLQGYTVTIWKLYDSCGVHFVRFGNVHIFMLVEKRYPLTPITITNMLNKKLQTDYWNEMCYQLLKLMIQKMNIKFRGGLLGLKRLQGFLELLLLSIAGEKVYAAELQLLEDLLLSRG
ncbi:hypothetical protein Tco_1179172 [Tanacetum coccineum]